MSENQNKYQPDERRQGMALCLSGGGFRATLFHLGALRRLNELGLLSQVSTISSVSGGSILNGVLATRWNRLRQSLAHDVFNDYAKVIEEPMRAFCRKDLRTEVLLWDRANVTNIVKLLRSDFSVTNLLARAYADALALDVPFTAIPASPRFVFCASNMETGANWEFGHGGDGIGSMGDYKTGYAPIGELTVADAVTASSAFPITFPPLLLTFDDPSVFKGGRGNLPAESLRSIPLTDGGVYDNLGLEPVWKSHKLVLVSDAGKPFDFKDDAKQNLLERLSRSFDITANQSAALRKRWLISMFQASVMHGTYWGIGSDFRDYHLEDGKGYEPDVRELLTNVRTDLDAFTDGEMGCLENHGYALVDSAVRKWLPQHVDLRDSGFSWPHPEYADQEAAKVALGNSDQRGMMADVWKSIRNRVRVLFAKA